MSVSRRTRGLGKYILHRLLLAVPTFLVITFVVYAVVRAVPATPGIAPGDASLRMSPGQLESHRERYGLDRPVIVGYVGWLGRLARLDLGRSFGPGREPVARLIAERLPATLLLNGCALALALAVAVPLGITAAAKAGRPFDRASGLATFALYSLPAFWLALLLQAVLATQLRILPLHYMASSPPPEGLVATLVDRAAHLVLPTLCLALNDLAFLSRFVRAAVLEQLGAGFVRTARAKGLPRRTVLLRHGARPALIPLITLLGLVLPGLIGGTVIIERIFDWNGLGLLFVRAVGEHDVDVILALTALAALSIQLATLLADVAYAWADPRVRTGR